MVLNTYIDQSVCFFFQLKKEKNERKKKNDGKRQLSAIPVSVSFIYNIVYYSFIRFQGLEKC